MFLVIEGADGVGKTTLAKRLAEKYNAVMFSLPEASTSAGALFRQWMHEHANRSPEEWAHLAAASYNELRPRIEALLNDGATVICDRYVHSDYAYRARQGWSFEKTHDFHSKWYQPIIQPDLALWLDCPIDIAQQRIINREGRGNLTIFERPEMQEHVRIDYRVMANHPEVFNLTRIDASQSADAVFADAVKAIEG